MRYRLIVGRVCLNRWARHSPTAFIALVGECTIDVCIALREQGIIAAISPKKVERTMIIDAEPEPLNINCAETAVIVVDMQNDFCSNGGMFHRAGINISAIKDAVGPTR